MVKKDIRLRVNLGRFSFCPRRSGESDTESAEKLANSCNCALFTEN